MSREPLTRDQREDQRKRVASLKAAEIELDGPGFTPEQAAAIRKAMLEPDPELDAPVPQTPTAGKAAHRPRKDRPTFELLLSRFAGNRRLYETSEQRFTVPRGDSFSWSLGPRELVLRLMLASPDRLEPAASISAMIGGLLTPNRVRDIIRELRGLAERPPLTPDEEWRKHKREMLAKYGRDGVPMESGVLRREPGGAWEPLGRSPSWAVAGADAAFARPTCAACGGNLPRGRRDRKTCSPKCRAAFSRARHT